MIARKALAPRTAARPTAPWRKQILPHAMERLAREDAIPICDRLSAATIRSYAIDDLTQAGIAIDGLPPAAAEYILATAIETVKLQLTEFERQANENAALPRRGRPQVGFHRMNFVTATFYAEYRGDTSVKEATRRASRRLGGAVSSEAVRKIVKMFHVRIAGFARRLSVDREQSGQFQVRLLLAYLEILAETEADLGGKAAETTGFIGPPGQSNLVSFVRRGAV
jgi:hypothetical protein